MPKESEEVGPAYFTPATAHEVVGQTFVSRWITVDQDRITAFGEVTEDPDPHHVDPEFAARVSPWQKDGVGQTISFGFLTLSLLTPMLYDVYRYPLDGDPADGYPASYGCDRLRMIAPVMSGSRIRGHVTVADVSERKPGQKQLTFDVTVEIEGEAQPALVTRWLMLWITPPRSSEAGSSH